MYGVRESEAVIAVEPAKPGVQVVDLRSDTVTRPTPEMRQAMAEAIVGDDVYGEDPTVNRLQERSAEIFGREAALFVPSGSMGNLIAIQCWTKPGTELICDSRGHLFRAEMGALSAVAGATPRTAVTEDGLLTWPIVESLIAPRAYDYAQTALVCLENTHNGGGGSVYPTAQVEEICDKAHAAGLKVHMDGARIFNAAVYLGASVKDITKKVDSVMFCLSKGLGAPVGSMLVGSHEFIDQALRYRKLLGGGMRQAGILAAAGLIALEKAPARLHEDHANAKFLAEGLARIPGVEVNPAKVQTNIVMFKVRAGGKTAEEIAMLCAKEQVLIGPKAKHAFRLVTHCDVDRAGIERAIDVLGGILGN